MFVFAELYGVALDGKYRIGGLLGQGGMGAVFAAEHLGTGRAVAVKIILPQFLNSQEALERFRREARAAGRLRHPNIVDVTDFGIARVGQHDIAYLVMEYLDGMTLRALIDERGGIEPTVLVPIVEQIALALDAAHSAGMVHRDLKPDNVWLVPDARGGFVVRVLDFGIAKLRDVSPVSPVVPVASIPSDAPTMQTPVSDGATAALAVATPVLEVDGDATVPRSPAVFSTSSATIDSQPLTVSGSTLGTPAYMSPEQCRGDAVDLRSDIYSLGVMTYEAIAGKRPFSGNFQQLIEAHLHATPEPLDRIAGVPRGLAEAVARAMAKEPADRYPSAPAMAGSLYAAVEGATVVLRRSAALYFDHFPLFFKISLRAFRCVALPFVLSIVAMFFPKDLIPAVIGRVGMASVHLAGPVGSLLCWSLIMTMTNASFAVAIDLLRTRPLRPPSVDEIYAGLGARFGGGSRPGSLWFALKLAAFYMKTELKSAAGAGDMAFLIAFLEHLPPGEVPERCKRIVKGAGPRYNWIRGSFLPPMLVLPFVEGCVAYVIARIAHFPHPEGVAAAVAILSVPINAVFFNPILSTALVLLYFRSRQAIGEDVRLSSLISTGL